MPSPSPFLACALLFLACAVQPSSPGAVTSPPSPPQGPSSADPPPSSLSSSFSSSPEPGALNADELHEHKFHEKTLHDLHARAVAHELPRGKRAVAMRMLIKHYFRDRFMPEIHFAAALGDAEWLEVALGKEDADAVPLMPAVDGSAGGGAGAGAGAGAAAGAGAGSGSAEHITDVNHGAKGHKMMSVMLGLQGVRLTADELHGTTPLMLAAGIGGPPAVKALLSRNASILRRWELILRLILRVHMALYELY